MAHNIDFGIEDLTDFEIIGSGGFATVYSARDTAFNRSVAVKILSGDDQAINRSFERERTLMGQVSGHPNVITPYRHGYTNNGSVYLVMEYMAGGSLLDRTLEKGPMSAAEAIDVALSIADALAYSHGLGILHKDVKPANILISDSGIPKLSDFGISTIREKTATQVAFTMAHTPPETFANGFDNRDERSDFYSLASTLYAAITNRDPFHVDGHDSQVAYMRRIEQHPVPSIGIEYLDAFFTQALAKDPANRFATASEFTDALRTLRHRAEASELLLNAPTEHGPATAVAPVTAPTPPLAVASPSPQPAGVSNATNQLPYQDTMAAGPIHGQPEAAHFNSSGASGQIQHKSASESKSRTPLLVALVSFGVLVILGTVGAMILNGRSGNSTAIQSAVVSDVTYDSIKDVDFRNGPYFASSSGDPITVADGLFSDTEADLALGVTSISYGDLDDDGLEEAAVTTVTVSNSTSVVGPNLFRLDADGRLERLETTSLANGEDGQLLDAWIDDDLFTLEYANTSEGETPVSQRSTFNLADDSISSVGEDVRAMADISGSTQTVQFLSGTSSAVLIASESGTAILNVDRGQTIRVQGIGGRTSTEQIQITTTESDEQLARGIGQITTQVWERADYAIGLQVEPSPTEGLSTPVLFMVEIVGDVVSESTTTAANNESVAAEETTSSTSDSSTTSDSTTTSSTSTTSSNTTTESTSTSESPAAVGGNSLAGAHGLTLQWALFDDEKFGTIEFDPVGDEAYTVSGRHESGNGDAWVTVEGTMTKVSDLELQFSGTIVVSVSYINSGQPCRRDGTQTFLSTQGRQYWRMQDFNSPCDSAADYVDIYFN